jgi:hypothetical protein
MDISNLVGYMALLQWHIMKCNSKSSNLGAAAAASSGSMLAMYR